MIAQFLYFLVQTAGKTTFSHHVHFQKF